MIIHERRYDIFSAGPSITDKEKEYVSNAINEMWLYGGYPYINAFERKMADYVGRKYALALPSGTAAIHLSLLASGIRAGDEVIVPDFTWIATSVPLSYIGAKPIFVDVDRKTWCITAEEIKKHLTANTKAVIAVDMYGNMPEYEEIARVSEENNLILLEDSAEAIGSEYMNKKAGSFGKVSILSFQASKLLSTEEGGMLLTDDEDIFKKAQKLANCGKKIGGRTLYVEEVGYKYKYTGIQAAMGLAQLERIDEILEKRKTIFQWYKKELSGVKGIFLNEPGDRVNSNYWLTTIIFDDKVYDFVKEDLVTYLKKERIETRPVMYQLTGLPLYHDIKQSWDNINSEYISRMGINLPSPDDLTFDQAKKVVNVLLKFLKAHSKT